jgi:hypothetical protein
MADEPFDPLAYSEEQAKAAPPAFDPIAYSQAVVADPDRKTEAASAPVAKEPSMLDKYLGFQESQLAGATGGIGSLAGGLGYLGNLAAGGSPEEAEAMRQKIASGLTYSPRTEEGKRQLGEMGKAADAYLGGEGGRQLGDVVLDKTGSPGLAAAANTAVNIPQFLVGAKGGKEALGEPVEPVAPKPTVTQDVLKKGQDLGYVVPPTTTNPSVFNKVAEGVVGKQSTAQLASIKNQPITDSLVRKEFDLGDNEELTHDTMAQIRSEQSPAYQAVAAIPEIKFGPSYNKELGSLTKTADKITSALPGFKATSATQIQDLVQSLKPENGSMDGETAVELSKTLRNEASTYESSANRSGAPNDKALAKAYRGAATAVENAIQDHLTAIGKPELADNWDNARRTIAKTYSVQDALDGAGHVDASKLAKQSIKGKPLSGNLEAIADFANAFPKATNLKWSKESVPGLSPLDVYGGSALGLAAGVHEGAVLPALTGAAVPLGRMAGRSALLSGAGQKLARPSGPGTPGSIATPLGQLSLAGAPAMDEQGRQQ